MYKLFYDCSNNEGQDMGLNFASSKIQSSKRKRVWGLGFNHLRPMHLFVIYLGVVGVPDMGKLIYYVGARAPSLCP